MNKNQCFINFLHSNTYYQKIFHFKSGSNPLKNTTKKNFVPTVTHMRSKIYLLQNYVAITIPAITTTTSHDCCHFLIKISLLIPITHSASRQKRSTSYKKHPRQNKAISRVYNKGKSQISLFYTHSIHELGDAGRDAVIALAPVDGRATRLEGLPHLGPRLLSFVRMTAAAAFPRRSPAHARVHYC